MKTLLLCLLVAGCDVIQSPIDAITYPEQNEVIQQSGGAASFKVQWRGQATKALLWNGTDLFAESADGDFAAVPAGAYQVALVDETVERDRINIGVGDVYVVAGQSNAVSPRQPANYAPPVPATGKVILSDFYGHGWNKFIDPAVTVPAAGIAWLHAAMTLSRPYPVMFVIVARGNTSTRDWVNNTYGLLTRLEQAWARFQPKAILWHQGESDAALNIPQNESYANMDAVISSIRNVTVTPWVIAKNSTTGIPPAPFTSWPIRSAQQEIADKWPHVHLGPDTDPIRVAGQVDFMGDTMRLHGELWAQRITALGL